MAKVTEEDVKRIVKEALEKQNEKQDLRYYVTYGIPIIALAVSIMFGLLSWDTSNRLTEFQTKTKVQFSDIYVSDGGRIDWDSKLEFGAVSTGQVDTGIPTFYYQKVGESESTCPPGDFFNKSQTVMCNRVYEKGGNMSCFSGSINPFHQGDKIREFYYELDNEFLSYRPVFISTNSTGCKKIEKVKICSINKDDFQEVYGCRQVDVVLSFNRNNLRFPL